MWRRGGKPQWVHECQINGLTSKDWMSWNFTQVLRQFHPYDVQFKRGKKTVLIGILNVTLSLFWKCERHVWGKVSEAMIKPSLQSQRKPSSTRASRTRTSATVENHAGFTPQDEEKGRKNRPYMAVQDKGEVFNYRFACAMCMPLCGVTSQLQELKKYKIWRKKYIYIYVKYI